VFSVLKQFLKMAVWTIGIVTAVVAGALLATCVGLSFYFDHQSKVEIAKQKAAYEALPLCPVDPDTHDRLYPALVSGGKCRTE